MAAFHLFLNEFKQSEPSPSSVHESRSEIALNIVDSDYTKSLLHSLQANLQDLKDEAHNLKNASYREPVLSTIQTYRSTEKILDYRKPQKNLSSKNPPVKESKVSERNASFSKLDIDFPCYGRGKDPQPDVDIGYMRKTGSVHIAGPLKKVIYEKNFEKYLESKNSKKNSESKKKTLVLEEPEIIQYLREEFLRMTRRSQNLLIKSELVDELLKNQKLGELFGVDGLIDRVVIQAEVDNIGLQDSINIDEFLHFYQISKNNLLKSRQVLLEEKAEKTKEKNVRLLLKYLLDKFSIESPENSSTEAFIAALNSYLKPSILEILQVPPALYESFDDFIRTLENSEDELSIELLHKLFTVPEVFDYILPEKILKELQDIYNTLLLEEEPGVKTETLIEEIYKSEIIQENLGVVARSPQGLPSIPDETLDEIIQRIQKESPEWLTWEEFLRYFSIEGRPDEENAVTQTEKKPPLGFRYKITVPSPFTFSRREQIKQPSIRERRLKEMMQEDQEKIDRELENKFKAQPVPPEVKIPLFQLVMKEQEERRLKLKEHFEAITKSLEKPFSFYYRDMAKPEVKPCEFKHEVFHANPVPWFCKVALLEKMSKQEELRKDRIEKLAREKHSQAKMPSRMEEAAKSFSEKNAKTAKNAKTHKTPKFKAKEVPDFKSLQEKFAKSLASVKEAYVPKPPIPFKFHETHKSQENIKLAESSDILKFWSGADKKRAASAFLQPKIIPATTQKTKDMAELKQKFLKQREEDEKKRAEEEKTRKVKHEAMKRMMKKSSVVKKLKKNQAIEERLRERKEEAKRNEIEYSEKLQEIREKVSQRPFLIEQIASNSISRGFEGMEPMRRMLNQEYISEALTSQEQESSESFE